MTPQINVTGAAPDTEDIVAITQLIALYGHAADGSVDLGLVFTDDGSFDGRATGGTVHRGLDAIRAFFTSPTHPHPPSHQSTNPYVYVDGDVVRVLSKWMVIDRDGGGGRTGDYHDVVVRTEDGWRIRERVVVCRWWTGGSAGPIDVTPRGAVAGAERVA